MLFYAHCTLVSVAPLAIAARRSSRSSVPSPRSDIAGSVPDPQLPSPTAHALYHLQRPRCSLYATGSTTSGPSHWSPTLVGNIYHLILTCLIAPTHPVTSSCALSLFSPCLPAPWRSVSFRGLLLGAAGLCSLSGLSQLAVLHSPLCHARPVSSHLSLSAAMPGLGIP